MNDLTHFRLLTAEEVAAMLQVKVSWVREKTRKRCPVTERIPHVRLGKYVRFNEQIVTEWMRNGCRPLPVK
jgi:excisionase family DNA binding protein